MMTTNVSAPFFLAAMGEVSKYFCAVVVPWQPDRLAGHPQRNRTGSLLQWWSRMASQVVSHEFRITRELLSLLGEPKLVVHAGNGH